MMTKPGVKANTTTAFIACRARPICRVGCTHAGLQIASLLAALLLYIQPAWAATITVNSAADTVGVDGAVTLREAIISINEGADVNSDVTSARSGSYGSNDTIGFAIGSGAATITATSPLPAIVQAMTIDGTTQPLDRVFADGFDGVPVPGPAFLITLDGTAAGSGASGLLISNLTNTNVLALNVQNFSGDGISISAAGCIASLNAVTINSNGGAGLAIGGCAATLTAVSINTNAGDGIDAGGQLGAASASLTLSDNASQVTGNDGNGIVVYPTATLFLTSGSVAPRIPITANGGNGLQLLGAVSITGSSGLGAGFDVGFNGQHGVVIDTDQSVSVYDYYVHDNGNRPGSPSLAGQHGILLQRAGSGATILIQGDRPDTDISNALIHDNTGNGVMIGASAVALDATVSIETQDTYNNQVGIVLDSGNDGTTINMTNNNSYQNAQYGFLFRSVALMFRDTSGMYSDPCDYSTSTNGTDCNNVLDGPNEMPPLFSGNRMHDNVSNQLEFQGGGTYFLDAPDGSCNIDVNAAYCYRNRGSYGADTFAIHADTTMMPPSCPAVVGVGAGNACLEVWVNHFGFAGGNANNQDFEFDSFSLITALNKCTATSTCP